MIRLLCFVLAVLASLFKSKLRLEAENAALQPAWNIGVINHLSSVTIDDLLYPIGAELARTTTQGAIAVNVELAARL